MSVVALSATDSFRSPNEVMRAVIAYLVRWGRAPRVVLATSDDDLRVDLGAELRTRGFEVIEVAHARTLHGALLRTIESPETFGIDLFVVDEVLDGCSPLHAIGYGRQLGLAVATVFLGAGSEHARVEAERLELALCPREHAIPGIDRALLDVLDERWSERPIAA